jgi:serine/threonine-protein kinase
MMSRRPDVRPDFDELVTTLEAISTRMGGQVPPRHQDVKSTQSRSRVDMPEDEPFMAAPNRHRRRMLLAAVIGISVGVGAGVAIMSLWGG